MFTCCLGFIVDQALIEQIVSKVLTQLQRAPARAVGNEPKTEQTTSVVEITAPVITANLLAESVRNGQPLKIGRKSILTPAARDWLNTKKVAWSRSGETTVSVANDHTKGNARWQLILQSVTPTVRALHEGLKRNSEGLKIDLVGQPLEAATIAASALSTAERDGVMVVSEFAEIIACRANRSERVRAAVITDRKQLELARQHLGVNLVCVNPSGRTFIELRNLLRDCAAMSPTAPAGWN